MRFIVYFAWPCIAPVVNRRHLAMKAWVHSQPKPRETCGRSETGTDISRSTSVSPVLSLNIRRILIYSSITDAVKSLQLTAFLNNKLKMVF
jgi:hypothetical protein